MVSSFDLLFSWNFLLFSLGIFVMTYVVRSTVEYFFKTFVAGAFWNALCLAVMPPLFGAITGLLAKSYAYPGELNSTFDRVMFGAVAGLLSTWVYKVAKDLLKSRIQSLENDVSNPTTTPSDLNK